MPQTRTEALTAVLDDLAGFEVGLNDYYDDPEPQGVFDNVLTGKIDSLRAFYQILGWPELVATMQGMTPLPRVTLKGYRVPHNGSGNSCIQGSVRSPGQGSKPASLVMQ